MSVILPLEILLIIFSHIEKQHIFKIKYLSKTTQHNYNYIWKSKTINEIGCTCGIEKDELYEDYYMSIFKCKNNIDLTKYLLEAYNKKSKLLMSNYNKGLELHTSLYIYNIIQLENNNQHGHIFLFDYTFESHHFYDIDEDEYYGGHVTYHTLRNKYIQGQSNNLRNKIPTRIYYGRYLKYEIGD